METNNPEVDIEEITDVELLCESIRSFALLIEKQMYLSTVFNTSYELMKREPTKNPLECVKDAISLVEDGYSYSRDFMQEKYKAQTS